MAAGVSRFPMGSILDLNVYGLRARIRCFGRDEEEGVSRLLSLFLTGEAEGRAAILDFKKRDTPQEIGRLLFPLLAERRIWAMHSGGFHFQGGCLAVGPSNCGKSTFSHMAMQNGFDLLSDDITLLRKTHEGVEMLPLYSVIYLKDGMIRPGNERFKPAMLKFLLFPQPHNASWFIRRIQKKSELLRRLVPQFLWSHSSDEQQRQKRFLEGMCRYPAYELHWGPGLFHDHTLLRTMLDEIVQSEGSLHASLSEG